MQIAGENGNKARHRQEYPGQGALLRHHGIQHHGVGETDLHPDQIPGRIKRTDNKPCDQAKKNANHRLPHQPDGRQQR